MVRLRSKSMMLVLAFFVLGTILLGVAQGTEANNPSDVGISHQSGAEKAKEILAFGETTGGLGLVVTRKETTLHQENPKELALPVTAINRSRAENIRLETITVSDSSAMVRAKLEPGVDLEGTAGFAPTRDDVLAALVEHDTDISSQLFKKSYVQNINIPLEGLSLRDGDSIKLIVGATFSIGKKKLAETTEKLTATTEVLVTIASLPSRTNWYGGDGHIHSSWSKDVGGISINNRARYAADNGFKWIIMTDHSDGIGSFWGTYVSQCNSAQSIYKIVVSPGAEIASSPPEGHVLGYWLSQSSKPPTNGTYLPQDLINEVTGHNPDDSYAVIAHPYRGYPWPDWSVTGFKAMELLSYEIQASDSTINKWFELLRAGLSGTIAGNGFVVGLGNTDAHNFMAPGDDGFTWLYSDTYSPTNRGGIWAAIKAGRVSASGRKDLGVFALNDAAQGSVIPVSGSGNLTFKLIQQPVTGRKCTQITIRDKDNTVIYTVSNPTSTETYWTTSAPAVDNFYVVKFVFSKTDDTDYSHVWANPIFVDRI